MRKYIFELIKNRLRFELGLFVGRNSIDFSQKAGKKILFIHRSFPEEALTVSQTVYEYRKLSKFSIDILNISNGVGEFSEEFLSNHSAIIIHQTAAYNLDKLERIGRKVFRQYGGIKVIMKQDEDLMPDAFADFFDKYQVDLLCSIWDVETATKVYKSHFRNSGMHLMQSLTGYVPDEYNSFDIFADDRDIDVGYRGSTRSLLRGRLVYEKWKIGDSFIPYGIEAGLKCDISSDTDDRFTGKSWLDFLMRCKAVLGVESGSDIVGGRGDMRRQYYKYRLLHPNATEEEILDFVDQFKGEITYRAISPRIFEAAACGALQVLYEGEYQGIIQPYMHYVPLKRDFSNIEEVIDYIKDDDKRKEIVTRAREDLILSGKYSFRKFTEELDEKIEGLIEERGGI